MASAERHAVVALMPAGWQLIGDDCVGEYGLSLLLRRQVAGKLQAEALFVLKCDDSGIFPLIDISRLRPHEGRRQRHLFAQDETGDNQMMAAQLPSPRLGHGWLAEDVQLIAPLAEQPRRPDEVAEKGIQLHQIARLLVACGAETSPYDGHSRFLQNARSFVESQTKVLVANDAVLPDLPLPRFDRQANLLFLFRAQPRQKRRNSVQDFPRGRAFGPEREEARNDVAVHGQALEGRGEIFFDAGFCSLAADRYHGVIKLLRSHSKVEGLPHLRNE